MKEKYYIKKVLNNNVVFSKNKDGKDIILTGLGLGFQKKKGEFVDENKIEHIFKIESDDINTKLSALLEQIPIDYFYIADCIKKLAEDDLNKELSDNIYVTLCAHIYYAVERYHKGLIFQNQLVWEIRRFYPEEYQVAKKSIAIVNDALNISLSEDEASFIALHIINAEINGKELQSVIEMTKLIKDICNIVQYEFNIAFDEESLTYTRFILHLKFFSQRLLLHENVMEEANFLYDQVEQNMSEAFLCAKKISTYIKKSYEYEISKSEIVYLTIHIQRLLTQGQKL